MSKILKTSHLKAASLQGLFSSCIIFLRNPQPVRFSVWSHKNTWLLCRVYLPHGALSYEIRSKCGFRFKKSQIPYSILYVDYSSPLTYFQADLHINLLFSCFLYVYHSSHLLFSRLIYISFFYFPVFYMYMHLQVYSYLSFLIVKTYFIQRHYGVKYFHTT